MRTQAWGANINTHAAQARAQLYEAFLRGTDTQTHTESRPRGRHAAGALRRAALWIQRRDAGLWQRGAALAAFDVLSGDSWRAYWVSPGVTSTGELQLLLCSSQDRSEPQEAPVGAEGSPAGLALLQGGRAWLWEKKGHRPLDVLRASGPRGCLVLQHHVHSHVCASSAQAPCAPSDQHQPVPAAPSLHVHSSLLASISPSL